MLFLNMVCLTMASPLVEYDLTDKKQKRTMVVGKRHAALGTSTVEPFPHNTEMVMFGMGCYWGAGENDKPSAFPFGSIPPHIWQTSSQGISPHKIGSKICVSF
jgi:hypothetical protein